MGTVKRWLVVAQCTILFESSEVVKFCLVARKCVESYFLSILRTVLFCFGAAHLKSSRFCCRLLKYEKKLFCGRCVQDVNAQIRVLDILKSQVTASAAHHFWHIFLKVHFRLKVDLIQSQQRSHIFFMISSLSNRFTQY